MEYVTHTEEKEHSYSDPSIHWTRITETFTLNGIVYSRSWTPDAAIAPDEPHFTCDDDKTVCQPHVLCGTCQGSTFSLFYGDCGMEALCISCGKRAEVSGE